MNNKRYLKSYEYNIYIILNELRKEIYKKGGVIVSDWNTKQDKLIIYNRTLQKEIAELKDTIQTITNNLKNNNYDDDRVKQLTDYKEIKEKALVGLEKIKDKRIVYNTNYLQFKLDNYIYYIQFDSNPYFNHYIHKQPIDEIKDNKYIVKYNYYIDDFSLDMFNEFDLYNYNLSNKDIKKIVNILYNYIINSKTSEIVQTKQKEYCYCCNRYYTKIIKEIKIKEYKEVCL